MRPIFVILECHGYLHVYVNTDLKKLIVTFSFIMPFFYTRLDDMGAGVHEPPILTPDQTRSFKIQKEAPSTET